ncbi:MAG: hypothetical protein ACI9CB_002088 [Rhodothermales bacterium]|jgi:hypothetical protein
MIFSEKREQGHPCDFLDIEKRQREQREQGHP